MKKYFAYSPDNGMEFFASAEEAKEWAQNEIDDCRDAMDEGWEDEFVTGICWGRLSERAKEIIIPDVYGSDYELVEVEA